MDEALWIEYARLLRQSWCNPSYKPWGIAVCQFEHAHQEALWDYFNRWQKTPDEEDDLSC